MAFRFFKCFVSKSVFWSRSRSAQCLFRWSRSKFFFTWSRSQKKYLEPEPRKNGSAPQHCWNVLNNARNLKFLNIITWVVLRMCRMWAGWVASCRTPVGSGSQPPDTHTHTSQGLGRWTTSLVYSHGTSVAEPTGYGFFSPAPAPAPAPKQSKISTI